MIFLFYFNIRSYIFTGICSKRKWNEHLEWIITHELGVRKFLTASGKDWANVEEGFYLWKICWRQSSVNTLYPFKSIVWAATFLFTGKLKNNNTYFVFYFYFTNNILYYLFLFLLIILIDTYVFNKYIATYKHRGHRYKLAKEHCKNILNVSYNATHKMNSIFICGIFIYT